MNTFLILALFAMGFEKVFAQDDCTLPSVSGDLKYYDEFGTEIAIGSNVQDGKTIFWACYDGAKSVITDTLSPTTFIQLTCKSTKLYGVDSLKFTSTDAGEISCEAPETDKKSCKVVNIYLPKAAGNNFEYNNIINVPYLPDGYEASYYCSNAEWHKSSVLCENGVANTTKESVIADCDEKAKLCKKGDLSLPLIIDNENEYLAEGEYTAKCSNIEDGNQAKTVEVTCKNKIWTYTTSSKAVNQNTAVNTCITPTDNTNTTTPTNNDTDSHATGLIPEMTLLAVVGSLFM